MKILLVEDDITISEGLKYYFSKNNFDLQYRNNLKDARKFILEEKPKLIILDVTLPDGNGFEFYQNIIKKENISTIFLTAKDSEDDIVKGFELGADDYITKPFMNRELLARVNKILRNIEKNNIIKIKGLFFDLDKMVVYKNDEEIILTSLEFRILELLILNINKVVSRDYIINKIWEWTGNDVNDNTITVYLKRIRDKLGVDIIKTIKGVGYRIDEK